MGASTHPALSPLNWNHKPTKILITGKSGSGKTTLFLKLLTETKARLKFCFDPDREIARKLRQPVCTRPTQLVGAILHRMPVICFDPSEMFPGDLPGAFAFFCRWVLNVSRCVNGPKLFAVDEVWRWAPQQSLLPQAVQELLDLGRREEIDLLFIAQRANKVHDAIRAQLTEIITFQHSDRLPLEWLAEDFNPDEVKALKYPGGFLRKNLIGDIQRTRKPGGEASADGRQASGHRQRVRHQPKDR